MWTIYKEVWAENATAVRGRIKDPRSRWDKELVIGFDSLDYKTLRSIQPAKTAALLIARRIVEEIIASRIADVRPGIRDSELSWWCPDLISALYLQCALLIAGDRPKRVCDNCGTLFPLTRPDKYHCDERCYRTAYNHRDHADAT